MDSGARAKNFLRRAAPRGRSIRQNSDYFMSDPPTTADVLRERRRREEQRRQFLEAVRRCIPGVTVLLIVHRIDCAVTIGGDCDCEPTFEIVPRPR